MIKTLVTHNGTFHADDVLAYVVLSEVFPEANLFRSRDEKVWEKGDIVFDVGGGKYDHHSNQKIYRKNKVPFAAAGLIWRDFGDKFLELLSPDLTFEERSGIHSDLDFSLFQGVDAIDNGVTLESSFQIPNLSDLLFGFNPTFGLNEDSDIQFQKAADFARTALLNSLKKRIGRIRARKIVETAFQERADRKILILPQHCPWLEAVIDIDSKKEVEFVVYPDEHNGFRIQSIQLAPDTFDSRRSLPKAWGGVSSEELNDLIGIDDAIFCHPGCFIAGAKSLESVLKMAELAKS